MNSIQVLSCSGLFFWVWFGGFWGWGFFSKSFSLISSLSRYFSKPAALQKHVLAQPLQRAVKQTAKADKPLTGDAEPISLRHKVFRLETQPQKTEFAPLFLPIQPCSPESGADIQRSVPVACQSSGFAVAPCSCSALGKQGCSTPKCEHYLGPRPQIRDERKETKKQPAGSTAAGDVNGKAVFYCLGGTFSLAFPPTAHLGFGWAAPCNSPGTRLRTCRPPGDTATCTPRRAAPAHAASTSSRRRQKARPMPAARR